MKNDIRKEKIMFCLENACRSTHPISEDFFVKRIKEFLKMLKPEKMWEERGVFNKKMWRNIYPDFIIMLKNKLIAIEAEKGNLGLKYELYSGLKFFDEIWFFTNIRIDQIYFYYKFENNLTIDQKFFGIDKEGKIAEIKLSTKSTVKSQLPRIYDEFFL